MNQTTHQRFTSSIALTFGSRLLMAANSVISGVLIARFLGAESLGIYLVLGTTFQILTQISGFALQSANMYFTSREPEKTIPIAVNSIVFALASGSGIAAIVVGPAKWLLPSVPGKLALVGLAFVPFQLITTYILNLYLAHGEIKKFNFFDLLNQSFVLINAVVALILIGGGLWLLVSLNLVAGVSVAILAVLAFYKYAKHRYPTVEWKGDISIMRPMFSYAFKGFVFGACTFLVYRLDMLIVNYFRGPLEASVYAVASQCTLLLLLLPHAVSHLLQARVSASDDADGKFTARVARHTSLLLFFACLAAVPGAFVVAAVYGSGFESVPLQVWILLPGVFFVGIETVLAQYFFGTARHAVLSYTWLTMLILNMMLNLASVPHYGAIGAAIVSTICYSLAFAVVYVLFRNATKIAVSDVLLPSIEEIRHLRQLITSRNVAS